MILKPLFAMRRIEEAGGRGTISTMQINGMAVCWMVENVDLLNAPNDSNIPAQQYCMRWTKSNRLGRYTWEVLNVPYRTGIRIHRGNTTRDTLGCPLPGMQLNDNGIKPGTTKPAEKLLSPGGGILPIGCTEVLLSISEAY